MQDKKHISVVAGGAGFIGSNLCKRLLRDGRHVVCIDNLSTGCFDNVQSMVGDDFEFIRHDITEPLPFSLHADEIYNLACPASPAHYQKDAIHTTKTAVIGTINMLELAMATAVRYYSHQRARCMETRKYTHRRKITMAMSIL